MNSLRCSIEAALLPGHSIHASVAASIIAFAGRRQKIRAFFKTSSVYKCLVLFSINSQRTFFVRIDLLISQTSPLTGEG
jgi:hypothetical protein